MEETQFQTQLEQLVQEIENQNPEQRKRGMQLLIRLYDLSKNLHLALEIDQRLKLMTQKIGALLEAERVSVMLMDKRSGELHVRVATGMREEIIPEAKMKFGKGIAGWVAESGKTLLVKDTKQDTRFPYRNGQQYQHDSFLVMPLRLRDRTIGLINVTNKVSRVSFTEMDQVVLEMVSDQLAAAIDQSLRYQEADRIAKAKVDFITIASHELRTPLTVIKETVSLLKDKIFGPLNEMQIRYLDRTKNHVDRLARLVNELLNIARLEGHEAPMQRAQLDLSQLIRTTVESFVPQAEKKGLRLAFDAELSLPKIWGDSDKLVQVLVNLISNSIKFTPKGGLIAVHAKPEEGDTVLIQVQDTGCGIPRSRQKEVFDRFKQLKSFAKEKTEGIGLGLAIAKEIVELHSGQIWVQSQVEKGSTFFVRLPIDPRDHEREQKK
ncbi:MAG: GAF domain-containing sensor histidine kinase [Candidatus Omnitrophica bacterium]|nr:GAF domain-containing sensor histidine kinase [Candidatus Omnitrophota bacterium]